MTELTVTPAAAWRRGSVEGKLYRMPGSGEVARLRRVTLISLAARVGSIPNPLVQEVLRMEGVSRTPKNDHEQIKNYQEWAQGHVEVAKLCFVEPRIVDNPNYEAGEIAPSDISEFDYIWIYNVFVKGVAADRDKFCIEHDDGRSGLERLATGTTDGEGLEVGG